MVDFAMDVHKSLYPDQEVPATLVEKRAQVVEQFKQLQSGTDSVLKIMTRKFRPPSWRKGLRSLSNS